jgi:16S rRNA (cytosine967-C5)-methyltransferase
LDPTAEFDDAEHATCAFLSPGAALGDSPLFASGGCYVQDTSARAAVKVVQARRAERIADWCAAPGGKSIALAIDQRDTGMVAALDIDGPRLRRINENVERLGLKSVIVGTHAEAAESGEPFDAVLVDAPCSNTGVIARRPEARFSLNEVKLASLAALQKEILAAAAAAVRPGGRLVYSTCSIEPEENELAIAMFAQTHPGWTLEASELTLPRWGPRKSDWRDGGFAARLRRST